MSGLTPIFPECPGYGFTAQPAYVVNIVRREQGYERSDRRWARCMCVYTSVPMGPRDESVIQDILNFWHAMGGRATPFAFKDWSDYKSCPTYATPTALDAPLVQVTLDDTSTAYQMTKEYSVGALHQFREVMHPVISTVLVANESGDAQTDFIVDDDTGLLKPGVGFSGTPTTWGGEFNVRVRFDSELDLQLAEKQVQSVGFTLSEKRVALSKAFSVGLGAWELVPPESHTIRAVTFGEGRLVAVDTSSNICFSDNDGTTWTMGLSQGDSNAAFFPLPCVSYGNGKFMMGGQDATSGASIMYSSADGETWAAVSSVDDISGITGIGYSGGSHWVATSVNLDTNNYAVSADNGATWTAVTTTPVGLFSGNPIVYDSANGKLVAYGAAPTFYQPCLWVSADNGNTWTSIAFLGNFLDNFQGAGYNSLSFDGTNFMLGGIMGLGADEPAVVLATTVEGLASASPISLIDFDTDGSDAIIGTLRAGGKLFAFGNGNGVYMSGNDGTTWGVTNLEDSLSLQNASVAFDSGASTVIAALFGALGRLVIV